jgi:DNA-binding transcriptional MerR regulator
MEQVALTVGQVAALARVSVRTLHHYDEIGLLRPSGRSAAGYRLYDDADLDRLHQVMLYRGLGFSLDDVAAVLDDRTVTPTEHLRRQLALLSQRVGELEEMRLAVERQLEARSMDIRLTREEQFEVFGPDHAGKQEAYAAEAEERWGDTDAWKQSQARTSQYTKAQWVQIKAEGDDLNRRLVEALASGAPATGGTAMDLAEEHRQQISRWFYDCPVPMHRGLADMYLADPRFTATYEQLAPGLAQFVHDAVHANADRQEAAG